MRAVARHQPVYRFSYRPVEQQRLPISVDRLGCDVNDKAATSFKDFSTRVSTKTCALSMSSFSVVFEMLQQGECGLTPALGHLS
jgi:hypothetical protein